jgi:hypothetical protein
MSIDLKEIYIDYLDALEESIDEQLRFEDSLHGIREEQFRDQLISIETSIEHYCDEIDFIDELSIEYDHNGFIVVEDSVIDISSSCETIIEKHNIKKTLKEMSKNAAFYFGSTSFRLSSPMKKNGIDLNLYKDLLSDVNILSVRDLDNTLVSVIKKHNLNKISSLFNKSSLKINHLYNHISKLLDSEISREYEVFCEFAGSLMDYRVRRLGIISNPESIGDRYVQTIDTYKEYSSLFKACVKKDPFDIEYFDIYSSSDLEAVDDRMAEIIIRSKIKSFSKKFIGSYKGLIDEKSYQLFEEIRDKGIEKDLIRNELKNIILFKSSEDLNQALEKIIDIGSGGFESVICKIEKNKLKSDVLYRTKNIMAVSLDNFKASKSLSPNRWCISYSESYYDKYGRNGGINIIVYNSIISKDSAESRVGITFDRDGNITHAFDKNNLSMLNKVNAGGWLIKADFDAIKLVVKDKITPDNKNKRSINKY